MDAGGRNTAEQERLRVYLANPKNKWIHRQGGKRPPPRDAKQVAKSEPFSACSFPFEMGVATHMPNGQMKITLLIPWEGKAEALKLTDAAGLLLQANVEKITGEIT